MLKYNLIEKYKTNLILLFLLLTFSGAHVNAEQKNSKPELKIVFLGDSITAGYGVAVQDTYVSFLERRLKKSYPRYKFNVVMAGISGSTSASAYSRLVWQLRGNPDILLLALGANDGLRGLNVNNMKENLSKAITKALENNIQVILAGMKALPNYGKEYAQEFEQAFIDIAQKHKVVLIPFLLAGVAGVPEHNIADGIHPNSKGQKIIADLIYPYLEQTICTHTNCE